VIQLGNDDIELKPTHMDDYLKQVVVDNFKNAINFVIQGQDIYAFKSYKMMFHIIEPYDFQMKSQLQQITEIINQYIKKLGNKPVDRRGLLILNNTKLTFKELVQIYSSQIPKAYAELGLWFKIITKHNDVDRQLSEQNFNSEISLLDRKKKELIKLNLTTKQLFDLMKANAIHDIYARWRIQNAIS